MITAAVSAAIVPMLAVAPALEFPAGMVTVGGIVIRVELELSETVVSVWAG